MEWVETTGRTVEAAKDAALDQLGVDEEDAEFEILEEAKLGLFGRLRSEARVRARIRPTAPRPKDDRRDRRRRRPPAEGSARSASTKSSGADAVPAEMMPRTRAARETAPDGPGRTTVAAGEDEGEADDRPDKSRRSRGRRGRSGPAPARTMQGAEEHGDRQPAGAAVRTRDGGAGMDVSLEEQGSVARAFLDGLVREMDLQADIEVVHPDEDTVEVNLEGADLGVLIGPKGATLFALQDLTRTVVQRKTSASNGRLLVDVSSYRQKRKAALERFARQLAEEVRNSGTRKVLEPMNAADRKIVHDTVNDIDGVATTSEGEDPNRRVVILPAQG
jgi:spoIIIJ-associated protein